MNFLKHAFTPFQQMFAAVAIFAMVLSLIYGAFPLAYAQNDESERNQPSEQGKNQNYDQNQHNDENSDDNNDEEGNHEDSDEEEDRNDDEGGSHENDDSDDEGDECDQEGFSKRGNQNGDNGNNCDEENEDEDGEDGEEEGDDNCDEEGGEFRHHGQQGDGNDCDNNNDDEDGEITIVAHKIVCTNESELPNWGSTGGPDITSMTASNWVAEHESCDLVSGWDFEWVPDSETTDPGDTLVGEAGGAWTNFGSTDSNGMTQTTISESALNGNAKIWLREVLKDGYIPFTHEANPDNSNAVSAEFYCNNDVINYDNYEWIDGIQFGHHNDGQDARYISMNDTYHCVAWNVQKETPRLCTVTLVSDTNTTVVEKENANAKLLSWLHPAWTAVISGASWIWGDDPVAPPVNDVTQNFERKFGWNGPVTSAKLKIAADNTFVAELNGDAVGSDLTEYNYVAPAKEYDVTSLIDQGNNKLGVEVYNMIHSTDPAANPAGLLYKLEVTGTNPECDVPYEEEEILGCTDDSANNYNQEATKDDGSCTYNEPSVCEIGQNLLTNGSFETPDVTNAAKWDIFSSGTPTLGWSVAWANLFGGSPLPANMELHDGVNGWLASEGAQYAELDSDWAGPSSSQTGEAASTRIAQTVATVPGNVYGLSFDFSARPGTGAGDNMLEVIIDGNTVGAIGANGSAESNTLWEDFGYSFEADSASTEIAFRDAGTPNSEGTLLDNVVLCLVEENDNDNVIDGYKWNDENGNGVWDTDSDTPEPGIAGWVIQVTNGEETYSTTTNAQGYYSFMVGDGSWTVTEVNQSGWEQTAPESESCYYQFGTPEYTRTMSYDRDCNFGNHQTEEEPELACSLSASTNPVYKGNNFDLIWTTTGAGYVELDGNPVDLSDSMTTSITEGTTYKLIAYESDSEESLSTECDLTVNTRSSGGGGGGKKVKLTNDGDVAGDSTSSRPDGEVLGDSTSIMPLGAANTGAGGTAENTTLPLAFALIGMIASLAIIRATKQNA